MKDRSAPHDIEQLVCSQPGTHCRLEAAAAVAVGCVRVINLMMEAVVQTCYYSYPATPLANYTPPEGSFPAAVYPSYTATGVWSYFSLDSGVAVIHLTPTTDNQLLFMERPGNRETDVRVQSGASASSLPAITR